MRISLKVIGLLWLGLFLIIGGLLFNAYSKLKPETFIALLTEQVQKNYPGAKLNVGKVSYRFSLDFNLNLQDIHLRRSGKLLGSIGEVELKVPWWLLLFNRGNAQINLSRLDIFVDHEESHAIKDKSAPSVKGPKLIKVELPSYLADAKFTLRAKAVSIRDIHNARRYFTVSKLLVREFQYGKNSAFEINIPIEIKHNDIKYSSDLWLFGDVTPEPSEWKLNYRGDFRTKESNDKFQIEDLVIIGVTSFVPTTLAITSNVNLLIDKTQVGNGNFQASQDGVAIHLMFSKLPLNYFGFVYEDIKNPYLAKLEGDAAGEVKFQKKFDALSSVAGKISFDGDMQLSETNKIPGKWQIGFQDNRWEVSFMSPKGEASFFRRSVLDMKKNTLSQYNEELGFSGLDLNQTIVPLKALPEFISDVPATYFTSTVSYKQCFQGEKLIDGNFRYGLSPDQKFYQGKLGDDKSSFEVNYSNKNTVNSLDMKFSKFSWSPAFGFMTPMFQSVSGVLDGKVEGRWGTSWESGQWLIQLSGAELADAKGKIPEFLTKTSSFFDIDSKATPKQSLNLSVKNNILSLNSLMLENTQSAKITGSLSPKQKSTLTLSYPKNKKFKPLKKEVIEVYWMQKEEI